MAIIDIILGALILYGLIKGLSKGFFVEVTSLLAYWLAFMGLYISVITPQNFCRPF